MSSVRRSLLIGFSFLTLAATALAGALPGFVWRGGNTSHRTYSAGGELNVTGSEGRRGMLRASIIVPSKWKLIGKTGRSTVRFGPIGSCRFTVTFSGRMVQAAGETAAADRAKEQLPAKPAYVEAAGTRNNAAFRVIRVAGQERVRGVLIQPLPKSSATGVPDGQRVYSELTAEGTADPKTECHSGGPRSVAAAFADAFAAGSAGGFVLR